MKITQLRDKDKTTALTTMDMETWIGKTRTEKRHSLCPPSEKCCDIPCPTHAATKQTSFRRFFRLRNSAGRKVENK